MLIEANALTTTLRSHLCTHQFLIYSTFVSVVLVVQLFGVGLIIERSLVRLPAGALSSQLGQLSLPSLRGR